jgi:ABC-type uncharacterized transport system permease subunit
VIESAPLRGWRRWTGAVLVVAFISGILVVLSATGFDMRLAASAMFTGAFGSTYGFFSATLVRATPLILAGLAIAISFRAGMLNIGAEGQLLAGATAAFAVGLPLGRVLGAGGIPFLLAAGALAGAALAGVAAWLRQRFGVLEVISTILLNFVAANAVGYLVHGPLQEPTGAYPQSATLPAAVQLPTLLDDSRLHAGFVVAVAACIGAWWWLRSTAAGFRLRAVGANATAARRAGEVDVGRVQTSALLLSGACAGTAGAIELSGVTFALYENISPGYGFTAIAVALLARLNPAVVIVTGILFGGLEAGATAMQRDAGVPAVIVSVIEAAVILIMVSFRTLPHGDWGALWSSRFRSRTGTA